MIDERWRELRVGDRIRIVRLPGQKVPGYYLPPMSRRVYKRLIARRRSVRISSIDEWGVPWFWCRFRQKNGSWDHHALGVNDDSWEKVKRRRT